MLTQQEQDHTSAVISPAQSQSSEAVVYLNSDGTIHSLNSVACQLLNVAGKSHAKGHPVTDFIHFSLESLKRVYQSFFNGTFSNSDTTVIPSVNARYAYTFSFDSDLDAVKVILKENPFN